MNGKISRLRDALNRPARLQQVLVPGGRFMRSILDKLLAVGCIESYSEDGYYHRVVRKPAYRIQYLIKPVGRGYSLGALRNLVYRLDKLYKGSAIISTNRGILSYEECERQNISGKPLLYYYERI